MRLIGVDFTSAPSRRKPITAAAGRLRGDGTLHVDAVDRLPDWPAFDALLEAPGPWVAAFDFPFGLPRELVESLGWPRDWPALIDHYASLDRDAIRATFAAFTAARPAGGKFAHRACDAPAGSSPSMKWVNPPVALMLHAGAPRLKRAGLHLPSVRFGAGDRVGLEGYPGLVARSVTRASYKNDTKTLQTPERRRAREHILRAVEEGRHAMAVPVRLDAALRTECVDDATGDTLDAVLCATQAAWAWLRRDADWGMPPDVDPLEGWIAGAPPVPEAA